MAVSRTIKKTDELFPKDNCKSRSEFIEKAIHFYSGYITSGENNNIFPVQSLPPFPVLLKALRTYCTAAFQAGGGDVHDDECPCVYREIDETLLQKLRGKCINDVKRPSARHL